MWFNGYYLGCTFIGALGRRTKFQQIDYTQLMAKAKINDKKGVVCHF